MLILPKKYENTMIQAISHAQAHQCRQHHQQGNDLATDILLFKAEDAVDERHDKAHTIEDERDEDYHSSILFQARKVNNVSHGDEYSHGHDAPTPFERLFLPFGQPNEKKHQRHHKEIVNGVPGLDGRR